MGQDVFLLGPPGPRRRKLALQYLELTNREHEYVALSRDTTESDIKQRREIVSGTARYFDQVIFAVVYVYLRPQNGGLNGWSADMPTVLP